MTVVAVRIRLCRYAPEMEDAKLVWKAAEIRAQEKPFAQRLNPGSFFFGTPLSRLTGLQRAHVSQARIPPGKDSFAYHAHLLEEEWLFIISGTGIVELGATEHSVGPGDFVAFPAGSSPHLIKNRSADELVYLMGGDNQPLEVVDYPRLGQRYLLQATEGDTLLRTRVARDAIRHHVTRVE